MDGNRRWVCLDVGEVLIDETRVWSVWADVVGVPRFTFMGVLGGVIARGGDHRHVFDLLGIADWGALEPQFESAYGGFRPEDLYPDALPAVAALRSAGLGVAVVANQPAHRHGELEELGVRADVMAMSDALGVAKPDPAFFSRVLELTGARPADVGYVGDRVDNDVEPAAAAGMRAVRIRRGPWGWLQDDNAGAAALHVKGLHELVQRVGELW
jgi:HAD superfamily hydrolase (TIGR01549 family)